MEECELQQPKEASAQGVSGHDSSDEDLNDSDLDGPPCDYQGTLSKWTNYIHGWQDRYFVLRNGCLSYFKSETEADSGCRGSISLQKASITLHEHDPARFDISVNDSAWYLRVPKAELRIEWVEHLEQHRQNKTEKGGLRRHGSQLSLASVASLSALSVGSTKRSNVLSAKLDEMRTYQDILLHQVDSLQRYFEDCCRAVERLGSSAATNNALRPPNAATKPPLVNGVASSQGSSRSSSEDVHSAGESEKEIESAGGEESSGWGGGGSWESGSNGGAAPHGPSELANVLANNHQLYDLLRQHGSYSLDFRGQALTFKATTGALLESLAFCIQSLSQRDEQWRRRVEREVDRRKRLDERCRELEHLQRAAKPAPFDGPDGEEGPHCAINEDEFFDAVEAALDRFDEQRSQLASIAVDCEVRPAHLPKLAALSPAAQPVVDEINRLVGEYALDCDAGVDHLGSDWELFAEETSAGGDEVMRMYRRLLEKDGIVLDPLKATHSIRGISARELCQLFWDPSPSVRLEWQTTLDSSKVVDWLADDTAVVWEVIKRVWPTTTRESCYWSHIRQLSDGSRTPGKPYTWMVVNHSTDCPRVPASKNVRIDMTIAFYASTVILGNRRPGKNLQRSDLRTVIQYTANVNPGGWVPHGVLREVYKREYPKFLKTFTAHVRDKIANKPIVL